MEDEIFDILNELLDIQIKLYYTLSNESVEYYMIGQLINELTNRLIEMS